MGSDAWAATTRNADYIQAMGIEAVVKRNVHRQEIVAGNIHNHLVAGLCSLFSGMPTSHEGAGYKEISEKLGDDFKSLYDEMEHQPQLIRGSLVSLALSIFRELPRVNLLLLEGIHDLTIA